MLVTKSQMFLAGLSCALLAFPGNGFALRIHTPSYTHLERALCAAPEAGPAKILSRQDRLAASLFSYSGSSSAAISHWRGVIAEFSGLLCTSLNSCINSRKVAVDVECALSVVGNLSHITVSVDIGECYGSICGRIV